ncbi:MAG: type transport system permease protein [Frankiaceae bacterium]|nr:type transport system permease protein [Frankiaceae bacterium]
MSAATLPRAMSAEWIKLKSVRSTRWTIATMLTIGIGGTALLAFAISNTWKTMDPQDKVGFNAVDASLQTMVFAQLVLVVLGVLAMTAEYSSGTIRATLAAVPRRITALGAKAIVFAAVAAIVSVVACFGAFFVAQPLLRTTGASTTIGAHGVIGSLLGAVTYLVLLGLIALGIGAIVRSTAAGISVGVGLVFILPLIASFLPGQLSSSVGKWLPMSLAGSLMQPVHDSNTLSTGMAAVMMAVYAAVALTVGGFLLVRRDA